MRKNAYLAK